MNFQSISATELQKEAYQVSNPDHNFLQQLLKITVIERQEMLIAYIQQTVTKAVGISVSELDVQQPLNYLGIDSLIAVKLRSQFRTDLEVDVPVVQFMQDSSVVDLATQVSEQIISQNREDTSQEAMNDGDLLEGEL
ncbi:acyl carrier protein [Nostoc sphaeroides]|uniref:Synthase n=1 Tax=Nostoc sphaeroides CCNUC1 TaxID=2653204 RepID=A0A5P8WI14_9NOSO|nr:acyl carrier protein [Nostoc sphaeroides]MCC5633881.1 acyl carrier protein [Nostoc sphaeroides CHAB 2801]QFS52455.1 synthase [Nostoc sphaeroides CCNUC1]